MNYPPQAWGWFGNLLFAFGALVLGWFVLGLVTGLSFVKATIANRKKKHHVKNWNSFTRNRSHVWF
jgi:ABC-type tungstate transport system substrate-binding protein